VVWKLKGAPKESDPVTVNVSVP
jgi:hypothetical protein